MTSIAFAAESGLATPAGEIALPLDAVLDLARGGGVHEALDGLNAALAAVRRHASAESWQRAVATARTHALREFVHRDPFTFRCFAKPRGYAGDAIALDYVLRRRDLAVRATDPVADLHHYTTHGVLARALLHRREIVANVIDEIALHAPVPIRIFAAGCGHLRECDRLRTLKEGRIERITAFDADPQNIEAVRREYPLAPVSAHLGSVRQLLEGRHLFDDMDFAHSGSLMETLPQGEAQELTRALLATVKPGGTLLVSNPLDTFSEAGYLEAYMDWRMVYRSRAAVEALAAGLPDDAVESVTYLQNPEATLAALAIRRR